MSKAESSDRVEQFDYELPPALIAHRPPARRDDARLLVVDRRRGAIEHARIRDLPGLLSSGDCLVLNDTRVVAARLVGRREATGGRWEGLYLEDVPDPDRADGRCWRLIGQTRGRLKPGEWIELDPAHGSTAGFTRVELIDVENGFWTARPEDPAPTSELLERVGRTPLPPYIRREADIEEDRERYQTVYASVPGAVAAPTAGLHFTTGLLDACRQAGIGREAVTLHVGIGTFRPIVTEQLVRHTMHAERCRLTAETAGRLNDVRHRGGRIVAVGTTVVRTLESAARTGRLEECDDRTDLFIRPGHDFRAVDALLTNFHLPRSTLFVLVCGFCGLELAHRAYRQAIDNSYRFYSYGDAMLIL